MNRTAFSTAARPVSAPMSTKTAKTTRRGLDARETRGLGVGADRVDRPARRRGAAAPRRRRRSTTSAADHDEPLRRRPGRGRTTGSRRAGPAPTRPPWPSAAPSRQRPPSWPASRRSTAGRGRATSTPFTAPERRAGQHARAGTQRHGHARLGQQAGGHAADRELRADRDVDLAGQDHERHPERRPAGRARCSRAGRAGCRRGRTRAPRRRPRAQQSERKAAASRQLARGSRPSHGSCVPPPPAASPCCPRASARTRSGVAAARSSVPTMRPAVHHRDAVAHARGSRAAPTRSSGWPRPRAASSTISAVDLGLRADVDALRRLVEDQHRGLRRQPAAERDLLLVAAGERRRPGASSDGVLIAQPPARSRRRAPARAPSRGTAEPRRCRRATASVMLAATGISRITPWRRRSSGT